MLKIKTIIMPNLRTNCYNVLKKFANQSMSLKTNFNTRKIAKKSPT